MKVLARLTSLLICLAFMVLSLASCSDILAQNDKNSKEKFTKTLFEYFDTVTTLTVYAKNRDEFLQISELVENRLSEYHKLYDAYHSKDDLGYEEKYARITNIKDINSLVDGVHREQTVDRKIIDLLLYCKEMYRVTNGETNVAMGSVLRLWHNERDAASINPASAKLPDFDELKTASEHIDIEKVVINEEQK